MYWRSFVLPALKTSPTVNNAALPRRSHYRWCDRWSLAHLGGKEMMVEMFWLPSESTCSSSQMAELKGAFVRWDSTLIMSLLTWGYICCKSLCILLVCEQYYFFRLNMKHRDKLAIMRPTTDESCHARKYMNILDLQLIMLCLIHQLYCKYLCYFIHNQKIGFNVWVMEVYSRAAPACFSLYWLGFKSGLAESELSKIIKNVDCRYNDAVHDRMRLPFIFSQPIFIPDLGATEPRNGPPLQGIHMIHLYTHVCRGKTGSRLACL